MVIVVSEETGGISIAYRNSLRRKLSIKELEAEIKRHWAELFREQVVVPEKVDVEDN
jgi:diadenylate cyclase